MSLLSLELLAASTQSLGLQSMDKGATTLPDPTPLLVLSISIPSILASNVQSAVKSAIGQTQTQSLASATSSAGFSDGIRGAIASDMAAHPVKGMCRITMLWNWNTIDACFILKLWHVKSKGGFAGSCIGVFLLALVQQWLHRFVRQYDVALMSKYAAQEADLDKLSVATGLIAFVESSKNPFVTTVLHKWLTAPVSRHEMRVLRLEHLIRTSLFAVDWFFSYIIMLLFMYFNGYIIIMCLLGAFVGRLVFTYNEPLSLQLLAAASAEDRKCCR